MAYEGVLKDIQECIDLKKPANLPFFAMTEEFDVRIAGMTYEDYWGRIASHQDGHIEGDIYQCVNEECEMYEEYFHTHREYSDDIHEGYPC